MKKSVVLFLLAASACIACSKVTETEQVSEPSPLTPLQTKAVNTVLEATEGVFLVKLDAGSGIEEISALEGIKGVSRLFNLVKGKEELEKRFGLDRWWVVDLAPGASLEEVAARAASFSAVEKLEFNTVATKPSLEGAPVTEEELLQTKATADEDQKIFNDPMLKNQWHYINTGDKTISSRVYAGGDISVKDVWRNITCGDPSVIVAVVDEGVKWSHPDLADAMWTNEKEIPDNGIDDDHNGYIDDIHGYNFVDRGAITWDKKNDSGHGTHTAGTIGAINNNGTGVCGVAGGSGKGDGVRIMSGQIFSNDGGGSVQQVANAIKYAADNGASLISCSFGYPAGTFTSDGAYKSHGGAEYDAMLYFQGTKNNDAVDGGIIIFSAGNNTKPYAGYPGALSNVITVSALGPDYLPAYYTNYGPGCKISAPGGEMGNPVASGGYSKQAAVLSTYPSELDANNGQHYYYMQGTSMACPHVTGVAALGISYALKLGKHYTVDEFNSMIVSSAKDIDGRINKFSDKTIVYASGQVAMTMKMSDYYHQMGSGCIDAWSLMMKIEGVPCSLVSIGSDQWIDLSPYFGTSSTSLTYTGLEVSEEAKSALGLVGDPELRNGRIYLNATKIGSAKMTIHAIGGGSIAGSDSTIGGMPISREISIITRGYSSGSGGWL